MEMVGEAIDSATTYEPYGKLLARSGDSGTVYGYTGEQHPRPDLMAYWMQVATHPEGFYGE